MRNFRKAIATLSVVAIMSSLVVSTTAFAGTFDDVPADAYYFGAVESLADAGIVDSTKANYEPARQLQRQEAAKLIVESAGLTADVPDEGHFMDVPNTLWSFNPIETAYSHGVVNGYSDEDGDPTGYYGPTDTVKRAEFAKMSVEAFGLDVMLPEGDPTFDDVQDTDSWFFPYVETAAYHGIVTGYGDGNFGPMDNINRADGAVMIHRAMGEPEPPVSDDEPPVGGGEIDIDLGDTPASDVIPKGATRVPFLVMDVDGEGTLKSLTFERFGAGATSDFANVYLYEGDTRLTTGRSLNSSTHRVTFTGLNFDVDGMHELTLVADISTTAAANVNGFRLYDVTSDDSVSYGDIEGELMSISSAAVGTVTIEKTGTLTNPKVAEAGVKVSEFRVSAGSSEAVDIYGVTLYQVGNVSRSNLMNFSLMQGSEEMASADDVNSNDNIVLTFDDPYHLDKGDSRTFELWADVGSGARANDTVRIYLDNDADLFAMGSTYGYGVGVTRTAFDNSANDGTDASWTTIEGGQITLSFQGPSIQDYAVDSKDKEIHRFNVIAQNQVEVRNTRVTITAGGTDADADTTDEGGLIKNAGTDAALSAGSANYTDIKLVDVDSGDVLAGPFDVDFGSDVTDARVLTDVWTLEPGEARTLAWTADIANFAPGGGTPTDETIKIQLDAFQGNDIKNLENNLYVATADIVPSSSIIGNAHRIKTGNIAISVAGTPSVQTYINGSDDLDMLGVIVQAGEGKDVYLKSLTVTATGGGYCLTETDCVLTLSLWDGDTQVGSTKSLSTTTATFNSLNEKIDKGTSKTYLVKSDLNTLSTVGASNLTGTTTITNGSTAVTGVGTAFTTELSVGTYVYGLAGDSSKAELVTAIASDTALTIANNYTGTTVAGGTARTLTSMRLGLPSATDVTVQDSEGNSVTPTGTVTGPAHIVTTTGTLTAALAPDEIDETESRIVVAGKSLETLGKYRLTAQNEPLKLSKSRVEIPTASTDEVNALYLYNGDTLVAGPVTPNSSGNADFNSFSEDFVIAKDETETLTIKGDLNTISAGADSGATFAATLSSSNFEARSAASTQTVLTSATGLGTAARTMTLRKTNITIDKVATSNLLSNGSTQDVYKFTVEVDSAEDASLRSLGFDVVFSDNGTADTLKLSEWAIYRGSTKLSDAVFVEPNDGTTANSLTTSDTADTLEGDVGAGADIQVIFGGLTGEEFITAGSTVTYTLRAKPEAFDSTEDDGFSISLPEDVILASPAQSYLEDNDATASEHKVMLSDGTSQTAANLIWSDNSAIPHLSTVLDDGTAILTSSSDDWFNGYQIKNSPIGSSAMNN